MKRIVDNEPQRVGEFVSRLMGNEGWSGFGAIGVEEDGELIAGAVYDNYNGASISMHIAALPGKRWMMRKALWFAFYYPFCQLNVNRISGFVSASNREAQRFAQHLGFELEACMKDAHPDGDVLVYRMFKEDCRFLEMKNVKP